MLTPFTPSPIPVAHLEMLCVTIDALRGETEILRSAGLLTVGAQELLDGGGTANAWLAEVADVVANTDAPYVVLPDTDAGLLQHIVYGLSAVLVWAHELHGDGRIRTTIPMEALAAWAVVERLAGLGGRTAMALGMPTTAWSRGELLGAHDDSPDDTRELVAA